MKIFYALATLFVLLFLSSCGSYVRIGDLTGISNRNIDNSADYVQLKRDVEKTIKAENDALERAIDEITKEHKGEFLRNAKIYVKNNGKKVRVVGDVWGTPTATTNVSDMTSALVELNIGDAVLFDNKGSIVDGKIIGLNANAVIVEFGLRKKKLELRYDEVTKAQ